MKRRKILAIVLSFALVFSMTSAFTIATSAAQDKLGAVTPTTPESIMVNGVELTANTYVIEGEDTSSASVPHNNTPADDARYAYYKVENGVNKLILHNYTLTGVTGRSAIKASTSGNSENTLYIVLEGTNKIEMGKGEDLVPLVANYSAIAAKGLRVIISAETEDASLNISSQSSNSVNTTGVGAISGIRADGFELQSGDVSVTAGTAYENGENCAILTEKEDVIISGGNLTINSAYVGIKAAGSVYINGGNVTVEQSTNDAIRSANADVNILKGKVVIKKAGQIGISANKSINISGGNIEIDEADYNGLANYNKDINVSGDSVILIKNAGNCGFGVKNSINISGGSITVEKALYGLYTGCKDINISGGNIEIGQSGNDAIKSVLADVNISGGSIIVGKTTDEDTIGTEKDADGIYAANNLNITGGFIDIRDASDDGVQAEENLNVSNATLKVVAKNFGVKAEAVAIENSEVDILSTSEEYGYRAIEPNAKISGNPVIKAGASKTDSNIKQVSATDDLSSYQYVHIYKEENKNIVNNEFLGKISKLFTWFKGFADGSFFTNSIIGKVLANMFKFKFI